MNSAELIVKYIPNNSFKKEHENETNVWKLGYDLLLNNYIFQRHRTNKPKNGEYSLNWRCSGNKDGCAASITIRIKDVQVIRYIPHNIEDNLKHRPLRELDVDIRSFKNSVKNRCTNEEMSLNMIFNQEQEKFCQN